MANTIVVKNRAGSTGEPTLIQGEIAANIFDKQLYIGTGSGNIVYLDQTAISAGYQALNAYLTDISNITPTTGGFIRFDGTDYIELKNNISATAAPTATDDSGAGYAVGSVWLDTTNDKAYIAMDVTSTAAVWVEITQSGSPDAVLDGDFVSEGVMYRGATAGTYSIKVIGTDIQAYAASLNSIAGLTTAANKMIYTTALDTYAVTDLTTAGRALLDDADAAAQRTTLGLGSLATLSEITTSEIAAATLVTAADTIASNDNDTTIPTTAAVIDYVTTSIAGGVTYQGGYNATTNTPDLDTTPTGILKGYMYTVTAAVPANNEFFGTIGLEIGDVLIAEIDSPTVAADWTIVQRNIIDDTLIDGGTY